MSRITQRPRQIDLNKPVIKYDNYEEFLKLDTTNNFEVQDTQITLEKGSSVVENNPSSSANKKKDQVISATKDKKGKIDVLNIPLQKQDILIPEAKKLEEENKN